MSREFRPNRRVDAAHADAIWTAAWAGDLVVTGSVDESVRVWRPEEGSEAVERERELEGHQMGVVSVAVDPTGSIVAASSVDCVVRCWKVDSGTLVKSFDCEPVETWTLAYHPSEPLLATGSQSGKVNVWNTESGEKVGSFDTHGKFVMSVAYSPDGRLVCGGGQDGVAYVFDTSTGVLLHKLEGHTMPIRTLAFTCDGQALMTGSDDGRVNVYDVSSRDAGSSSLVASLTGHLDWVLGVAAHPTEAGALATGSSDKRVKIWDRRRNECVQTIADCHTEPVWSVAYNADGTQLASVSDDASLQLYSSV